MNLSGTFFMCRAAIPHLLESRANTALTRGVRFPEDAQPRLLGRVTRVVVASAERGRWVSVTSSGVMHTSSAPGGSSTAIAPRRWCARARSRPAGSVHSTSRRLRGGSCSTASMCGRNTGEPAQ